MRKIRTKPTIVLLIAFCFVSLGAISLSTGHPLQGAFSTSAVGTLILLFFQLARDAEQHENALLLLKLDQKFGLGATSHMASVAFDKHVLFCEEYLAEVDKMLAALWHLGPSTKAVEYANSLLSIRNRYTAWVTPEITQGLEPFESAIRHIGAAATFIGTTTDIPEYDEQRSSATKHMFRLFSQVMNIDGDDDDDIAKLHAAEEAKTYLRRVLGIDELTSLRKMLLTQAISTATE